MSPLTLDKTFKRKEEVWGMGIKRERKKKEDNQGEKISLTQEKSKVFSIKEVKKGVCFQDWLKNNFFSLILALYLNRIFTGLDSIKCLLSLL